MLPGDATPLSTAMCCPPCSPSSAWMKRFLDDVKPEQSQVTHGVGVLWKHLLKPEFWHSVTKPHNCHTILVCRKPSTFPRKSFWLLCILVAAFSPSLGCIKAAAFHQVQCMCIKVYFGSKVISAPKAAENRHWAAQRRVSILETSAGSWN